MHRHEMDVRLVLDQRLRPIAVVDVPIDDEDAIQTMPQPGVVGSDGDVSEETEPHRASAERVMPGRANRTKASCRPTIGCHVHGVQDAADGCRGSVPRAGAGDGVGIEVAAARFHYRPHSFEVRCVVRERELV
jgi:hypothetical protein